GRERPELGRRAPCCAIDMTGNLPSRCPVRTVASESVDNAASGPAGDSIEDGPPAEDRSSSARGIAGGTVLSGVLRGDDVPREARPLVRGDGLVGGERLVRAVDLRPCSRLDLRQSNGVSDVAWCGAVCGQPSAPAPVALAFSTSRRA